MQSDEEITLERQLEAKFIASLLSKPVKHWYEESNINCQLFECRWAHLGSGSGGGGGGEGDVISSSSSSQQFVVSLLITCLLVIPVTLSFSSNCTNTVPPTMKYIDLPG